ncbi:MAG: phosphatase PAP2 family protein [Pygmaiobacter sp.]|nr:phosphatase PAP2 family protein [Pygmaiobacter sp.]
MAFEFMMLDWIGANLHSAAGDVLMPFVTALGNGGVIWIALGLSLCAFRKTRRYGVCVLLALGLDVVLCNGLLKPLVARVRPCDINTTVQLLIARPTDFSFPSGHTAAGFAAASALLFSRRKGWWAAMALAALIAFSRLYLYVHFLTDVLAGAMLGVLCGWAGVLLSGQLLKALKNKSKPQTM